MKYITLRTFKKERKEKYIGTKTFYDQKRYFGRDIEENRSENAVLSNAITVETVWLIQGFPNFYRRRREEVPNK